MATSDVLFAAIFSLTLLSGVGATVLVLGDSKPGSGRKAVALKLAQIALLGAGAIAAMIGMPT